MARQLLPSADCPSFWAREVVEDETVALGGRDSSVYACAAIDIFTKEPSIVSADNLEMATAAQALDIHHRFSDRVLLQQSDNDSEFQSDFKTTLEVVSNHR